MAMQSYLKRLIKTYDLIVDIDIIKEGADISIFITKEHVSRYYRYSDLMLGLYNQILKYTWINNDYDIIYQIFENSTKYYEKTILHYEYLEKFLITISDFINCIVSIDSDFKEQIMINLNNLRDLMLEKNEEGNFNYDYRKN